MFHFQNIRYLAWMVLSFFLLPLTPIFAAGILSPFSLPPEPPEAPSPSRKSDTSPFLLPPKENDSLPLTLATPTAIELQKKGTQLAKEGKLKEARVAFERSLEKDPGNLVTLNNLGLVMRKLDRFADAQQAYYQALEIDENYALTYKNFGILLEKQGEQKLAVQVYERYCTLAPNATDTHKVAARAEWLTNQPDTSTLEQEAEQEHTDQYMKDNALKWHDLGAHLFAESVVEKDRKKLFTAIDYLESATIGLPENNGITVDLADAYMAVDSPTLTALAIDLYESVFVSFSEAEDPLVARLVEAYFQLRNFELAFAFSEQRITSCSLETRRIAAVQMSVIALSSQREQLAIAALSREITERGDDPVLRLLIATLQEAQGKTDAALSIVFSLLADNTLDSTLRTFVNEVKGRLLAGAQ